jgi:hypothetical protein
VGAPTSADVLALEASWCDVIVQLEEGRRDLEAPAVLTVLYLTMPLTGDIRLNAIEQAKAGKATVCFSVSMLQ